MPWSLVLNAGYTLGVVITTLALSTFHSLLLQGIEPTSVLSMAPSTETKMASLGLTLYLLEGSRIPDLWEEIMVNPFPLRTALQTEEMIQDAEHQSLLSHRPGLEFSSDYLLDEFGWTRIPLKFGFC